MIRQKPKIFPVSMLLISLLMVGSRLGCSQEDKGSSSTSAPAFSIKSLDGEKVSSEDFKGKVLFLHFWATWCKYCVHEIPELNELYAEYGKQGVEFLAVSMDQGGPMAVRALQQKVQMNYPIAMGDAKILSDFGDFRGLPSTFIITPDGHVYSHIKGYVPRKVLEQNLDAALKGKG